MSHVSPALRLTDGPLRDAIEQLKPALDAYKAAALSACAGRPADDDDIKRFTFLTQMREAVYNAEAHEYGVDLRSKETK